MKKFLQVVFGIVFVGFVLGTHMVFAAGNNAVVESAFNAASKVQKRGPAEITLVDQAVVHLPAGFSFIPRPEAERIMVALGNSKASSLLGIIFPDNDNDDYMVVVEYFPEGYIKDDDAKNWNTKDLFNSLKEGTDEENKERAKKGIAELEIIGWVQEPKYDAAKKHLVWAMSAKEKGANASPGQSVNYNTYILGREGYLTMNLITDLDKVEMYKPAVINLLDHTEFVAGKKYTDFNSSTDKVAAYGLAALVAGTAVKKLGLFALLVAFVLKWAKVLALSVLGLGALARKFWRKNKKVEPTVEKVEIAESKTEKKE